MNGIVLRIMERTIVDSKGREYRYLTNEIASADGARHDTWDSRNCVLLVLKQNGEDFDLINIAGIVGANARVSAYFRSWYLLTSDGTFKHADRAQGATHYGVIPIGYEEWVLDRAQALKQANLTRLPKAS
jgi:hypothetical protein